MEELLGCTAEEMNLLQLDGQGLVLETIVSYLSLCPVRDILSMALVSRGWYKAFCCVLPTFKAERALDDSPLHQANNYRIQLLKQVLITAIRASRPPALIKKTKPSAFLELTNQFWSSPSVGVERPQLCTKTPESTECTSLSLLKSYYQHIPLHDQYDHRNKNELSLIDESWRRHLDLVFSLNENQLDIILPTHLKQQPKTSKLFYAFLHEDLRFLKTEKTDKKAAATSLTLLNLLNQRRSSHQQHSFAQNQLKVESKRLFDAPYGLEFYSPSLGNLSHLVQAGQIQFYGANLVLPLRDTRTDTVFNALFQFDSNQRRWKTYGPSESSFAGKCAFMRAKQAPTKSL